MAETTPPPRPAASVAPVPAPRWPKITLIVTQVLYASSCVLWLAIAGLSVMAFDSPGSENDRRIWAFVIALWIYPVVVVVCSGLTWLFFVRGKRSIALGLNFFPALYIAGWFAIVLTLAALS